MKVCVCNETPYLSLLSKKKDANVDKMNLDGCSICLAEVKCLETFKAFCFKNQCNVKRYYITETFEIL